MNGAASLPVLRTFEDIAHAKDGMDQFGFEVIVDFGAQASNGDVDYIGVAVEVHVPDLGRDQGSGQHLAMTAG